MRTGFAAHLHEVGTHGKASYAIISEAWDFGGWWSGDAGFVGSIGIGGVSWSLAGGYVRRHDDAG